MCCHPVVWEVARCRGGERDAHEWTSERLVELLIEFVDGKNRSGNHVDDEQEAQHDPPALTVEAYIEAAASYSPNEARATTTRSRWLGCAAIGSTTSIGTIATCTSFRSPERP